MSYSVEVSFPAEPTKEDIKKLRKEVAYENFGVVGGGQAKSNPAAGRTGANKAKPSCKKD